MQTIDYNHSRTKLLIIKKKEKGYDFSFTLRINKTEVYKFEKGKNLFLEPKEKHKYKTQSNCLVFNSLSSLF